MFNARYNQGVSPKGSPLLSGLLRSVESTALEGVGRPYLKSLYGDSLRAQQQPERTQDMLWRRTRDSLRGTQIFHDLGLESVRTYRDYLTMIPAKNYDFYAPYIEKIKSGGKGVLFSDELHALIMTSGTSGFNDKLIPFNDGLLKSFQSFQRRMFGVVGESSGWNVSLSHNKLVLGANPALGTTRGIQKGYVSGVLATKSPKFLQKRVLPAPATLGIEDWNEKVARIAEETVDADIRMMAGVPAHLVNLGRDLLEKSGKANLCEIWPNLQTVVYSGTGVESYERTLNAMAGRTLQYLGMYLASEAAIGFEIPQGREDGVHEFVFALTDTLLSFVEAENPEGRLLGVHELCENTDYLVHVGTPNGLLQYAMRDVIRVVRTHPFVTFTVQGRQNQLLNIATEKVSVQQLAETIAGVEAENGTSISHFFVYPRQPVEGKAHYQWVVASDGACDAAALAESLDRHLMKASGDYQEERLLAKHIGAPEVRLLAPEVVQEYFGKNRNRGQFKMKTVFTSETEFEQFAREMCPAAQGSVSSSLMH
jgi:hypothetical protein